MKKKLKPLNSILFNPNRIKRAEKTYARINHNSNHRKSSTFDFIELIRSWPKIIGDSLSKNTIPLKHCNGVLTILTSHSVFSQQLNFMNKEISSKIIHQFPSLKNKIKKISFQTNSSFFNQIKSDSIHIDPFDQNQYKKTNQFNKYDPIYNKLKTEASNLFDDINDQTVKEMLISLYIQLKNFY